MMSAASVTDSGPVIRRLVAECGAINLKVLPEADLNRLVVELMADDIALATPIAAAVVLPAADVVSLSMFLRDILETKAAGDAQFRGG